MSRGGEQRAISPIRLKWWHNVLKIITPTEVLVYYDGPELFVATDQIGVRYICLLSECTEDSDRYLCAPVSVARLSQFVDGSLDLLTIFNTPETEELFCGIVENKNIDDISLQPILRTEIQDAWLPAEGFVFEREPLSDVAILHESCERNRAVVHLALNPPESRNGEMVIGVDILSIAGNLFQNLVKYAYKKSISSMKTEIKKMYESVENYEMQVFNLSPGSFKLHLQSKVTADLFGYTSLSKALEKIDEIVMAIEDPTKALDIFKSNKGHLISSYKKFLHMIIEQDMPISYEWTTPNSKTTYFKRISRENATQIYQMLIERSELNIEHKSFIGSFRGALVDTGFWTIHCIEDDKEYSGKLAPESLVNLEGVTLTAKNYKFICEEHIVEETVTGKEKVNLLLISYEEVK
jgi:hypothetical protein